jgi:hypothetical protein
MDISPAILFGAVSATGTITGSIAAYHAFRLKAARDAQDVLTAIRVSIAAKLDRAEHSEICEASNKHIQDKLDLIVGMINGQEREITAVREIVTDNQQATSALTAKMAMLLPSK